MSLNLFLSMLAFALVASITPGPVNILSLSSGVQHGFRNTMRHVTGATVGFTLLLLLIGLGMHELLHTRPWLSQSIRWGGVVFLLYMAIQLARDNGELNPSNDNKKPSYLRGALMQWLNPKAWLASIAGMGAYAADGDVRLTLQFAAIYFVVCYASLTVWAYAGVFLRRYFTEPRHLHLFNRAMALLLAASALYLLFSTD
ncbi:Cysteine/O-acetylserine efflux protein [Ephemeroptericola cinctiostellae]|uniref:Cysteine/O-acetylserine efflux protein n=1 Tax=Ephemeroptericola cinctiostellae TaxID=2268024 RepID=A0A345DDA6_9BURK|nr:LysE family translocator [Ephemeroptericola cinctiostellae]AXF86344.1 Cysteine/O-acetylserine efflux protein [Ephemeroptericola cinctiostellae]